MDKERFCENIRLCENAMYSLAFSLVRNDADAGEVLSEAIFRAWKNLDTLKKESSFKPWVLHIVHNAAVELIRKDSKLVFVEEMAERIDEGCENKITTRLSLWDAVQLLRQPYREVVTLFYYENLPVSKVARIMKSNTAAVKKQLSRARKMLREILKEGFEE